MSNDRRWKHAFRILGGFERRSQIPGTLRRLDYRVYRAYAIREGPHRDALPVHLREGYDLTLDGQTLRARCQADVVRLGKFDVDRLVRLRAFYLSGSEPSSVARVQTHTVDRDPGVVREVESRELVARHVPELAPKIHEFRVRRRTAFLREAHVPGRHPKDRGEIGKIAGQLGEALSRLHRGVGVGQKRLSDYAAQSIRSDWERFAREVGVHSGLDIRVRRLLERDALLDVSLGHGDLVSSNVVLTGEQARDGFVLVDWEHARSMPIAFDLAKVHNQSRDPARTLVLLRRRLRGTVGVHADCYGLEEQFALAHVQMLAWHDHRSSRASQAGRSTALKRDTSRRIEVLAELLETESGLPSDPAS